MFFKVTKYSPQS